MGPPHALVHDGRGGHLQPHRLGRRLRLGVELELAPRPAEDLEELEPELQLERVAEVVRADAAHLDQHRPCWRPAAFIRFSDSSQSASEIIRSRTITRPRHSESRLLFTLSGAPPRRKTILLHPVAPSSRPPVARRRCRSASSSGKAPGAEVAPVRRGGARLALPRAWQGRARRRSSRSRDSTSEASASARGSARGSELGSGAPLLGGGRRGLGVAIPEQALELPEELVQLEGLLDEAGRPVALHRLGLVHLRLVDAGEHQHRGASRPAGVLLMRRATS